MINEKNIEKYSSAITLSDMEIFLFPELLYSLLLANIMSPVIWGWKEDAWFADIERMSVYKRVLRLKQFIMDKYDFNLDLDTWGLTTKEKEIARFKSFMDEEIIKKSNALFGYEGDKYYFDIDIRRHFGIDKYNSNIIPYWKTETIEAMDAFQYKEGYKTGAGECVSLSTLYAAALFIICKIPLEDIYLLATPLHSQNFIDIREGVLTNNRRIITKNMWFNGTEITAKAQRAMRNEQVTIVSHNSGYVHIIYPDATIDPNAYEKFKNRLEDFLVSDINYEILCNFLRQESHLQKCFQIKYEQHGKEKYIEAEKAYSYEHNSSFRVNDSTRDKLLSEIDEYDFYSEAMEDRISLNKFNEFFEDHKIDFRDKNSINKLMDELDCTHMRKNEILAALFDFCNLKPRLPGEAKNFIQPEYINLKIDMSREEIIDYLESIRDTVPVADLSFYSYRDLSRCSWDPFLKAALERNPVSIAESKDHSIKETTSILDNMPNQSIYDGPRLAQPDEVWNYKRGDGLEKALCLANVLKNGKDNPQIEILIQESHIKIISEDVFAEWTSDKKLTGKIMIHGNQSEYLKKPI